MEPCERCSCTGTEVAAGEQLPQPLPRVLDRSETPVRLREQLSACPQGPLSPSSSQNCWQLLIAPCLEFTFPIGRTVSDLSCRDGIGGGDQQSALQLSGGQIVPAAPVDVTSVPPCPQRGLEGGCWWLCGVSGHQTCCVPPTRAPVPAASDTLRASLLPPAFWESLFGLPRSWCSSPHPEPPQMVPGGFSTDLFPRRTPEQGVSIPLLHFMAWPGLEVPLSITGLSVASGERAPCLVLLTPASWCRDVEQGGSLQQVLE